MRRAAMSACRSCEATLPEGARFCPACGIARVATAHPGAEHKIVTTLFADLVESTALGERHDPEDVDAALRAFYELCRGVTVRFGGVVEKFIGDAVVGVFGVPIAHEDDAERAVRAALEILARMRELPPIGTEQLQVRAGVNTGPALVRPLLHPQTGEGMLVGDAVNTAARLLTATPAMSVVVGATTRRLTERAIAYERLPAITVKGKAAPVERWVARGAVARRGVDAALDEGAPMIGREVELGVLGGLLDKAISSSTPQFALITGEAGIGKSRLVREFFRRVDAREGLLCTWRQGRCPAYGEGLTFWPLAEIVSAHAGVRHGDTPAEVEAKLENCLANSPLKRWLARMLGPLVGLPVAAEPGEFFAAWTRFIEEMAQVRPTVIVVEDLHWVSPQMLEFVKHLAEHAGGVPCLFVGTTRPEFLDLHPEALRYRGDLARIGLTALTSEESIPPEHSVPTGTSAISRFLTPARTASSTRSVSRARSSPARLRDSSGSTALAGSHQRCSVISRVSRSIATTDPGNTRSIPSSGVGRSCAADWLIELHSTSSVERAGIPAASRAPSSLANQIAARWVAI
jgi:class 3 adenylate cyclase